MLKRCFSLLLWLTLFCLVAAAQKANQPDMEQLEAITRTIYGIEQGAPVRQKVEELKPPLFEA